MSTAYEENPMQPTADDVEVFLCTLEGGQHDWRPVDRTPPGIAPGNPFYVCAVCVWCKAARCGHLDEPNPCLLPRHHLGEHNPAHPPVQRR